MVARLSLLTNIEMEGIEKLELSQGSVSGQIHLPRSVSTRMERKLLMPLLTATFRFNSVIQ